MSIDDVWQRLRAEQRPALIPYLTAGYPSRSKCLEALRMVQATGADLVEIGMPFSDPLADGPIIQESTHATLAAGMSVKHVLSLVAEAGLDIPVIAFGHLNPVLAYGLPAFLADAYEAGVSGLLLTDLPVGEDRAIETEVRESPVALVRLVAPTTDPERITQIAGAAQGFLYVISRLGVTGPGTTFGTDITGTIARLRAATDLPIALGFGIDGAERAREAARLADGVVVGSALVRRLRDGVGPARDLMLELAEALKTGSATANRSVS